MSAKRLMIEMALALVLATFAMSLDDVHATDSQNANDGKENCEQRLPALAERSAQSDNRSLESRATSDESLTCLSAGGPAKANNKNNDWLRLLP